MGVTVVLLVILRNMSYSSGGHCIFLSYAFSSQSLLLVLYSGLEAVKKWN